MSNLFLLKNYLTPLRLSKTGQDFGYDHLSDDIVQRHKKVLLWREWWSEMSGDQWFAKTYATKHGLFDPASHLAGIPKHDEDFGQTLGRWGVPPGPYLVLPLLGPSNPRDGIGLAVDSMGAIQTFFLSLPILASAAAVNAINDRSLTLEQVRAERESSFDFYSTVRVGYSQFRESRVHDRAVNPKPASADEDLYYLDDEEEYGDE